MSQQLDELFLIRARERGLLSESQVRSLRNEVTNRRRHEPEIGAHELAVEKGWLGVEAALALLDARPEDTIADLTRRISEGELKRYELTPTADDDLNVDALEPESSGRGDTERFSSVHDIEIDPEDENFSEVPKLVEPLPSKYAVSDQPSSDSPLEMELPPPDSDSGDSIFDDSDSKQLPAFDAEFDEPAIIERTPSARRISEAELQPLLADTALGDSLNDLDVGDMDDDEQVLSAHADLAPVSGGDTLHEDNIRSGRTPNPAGTARMQAARPATPPRANPADWLRRRSPRLRRAA
jgi:hypothetical protein